MATIHYKLPLDKTVDKDVIKWIDSLPRMKKGEMVKHAIRYYMAVLEEGEFIKFPNATVSSTNVVNATSEAKQVDNPVDKEDEKPKKVKPKMKMNRDRDAILGK